MVSMRWRFSISNFASRPRQESNLRPVKLCPLQSGMREEDQGDGVVGRRKHVLIDVSSGEVG